MKMLLAAYIYMLSAAFMELPISSSEKIHVTNDKINKLSVELRLNPEQLKDSGKISFHPAEYFLSPKTNWEYKRPRNGSLQIAITTEEPAYLNFNDLLRVNKSGYYLTEPGDDVVITSNGEGFHFSGHGAEKYRLQYQLDSLARSIPKTNTKTGLASYYLDSLAEYFAWTRYYQQKIDLAIPLLNSYKGTMSDYAFGVIADGYIRDVMGSLLSKFHSLKEYGLSKRKISNEILVQIYDTSYSKAMQEWTRHTINKQVVGLALREHQIQRMYGFDSLRMPADKEIQIILLADMMKVYKGQERERLIVNSLPKAMIKIGFTPELEKILTGYYAESGYPEWKIWMKEQELKTRVKSLQYNAPDFTLSDAQGVLFTNKDLQGKIAILHFQNANALQSKTATLIYKTAIEKFKNRTDIVFVNISVEKNNALWQKGLSVSEYRNYKNVIEVYTGGFGTDHPVIRDYAVNSFPCIWVIDGTGKVINAHPEIDLTQGNGNLLAVFIQKRIDYDKALRQKKISFKKDGPYVFHDGNNAISYSIDSVTLIKSIIDKNNLQKLPVQTDLDRTFKVALQPSVTIQPSVYPAAEKLMVFSDIEGNFDAFRKLLQANKVIDENFNWIFGKGHLVFAGDMFDRGMQVTECLWLMYALEEKAKAAGGYVHFVLGNHEIMNMQGNHYYTENKYKTNAALMGKSLTELYSENTELGRWLRTKNIIEKIGDLLFVHGGISPEMNRSPLGIEEINALARPYYSNNIDSANKDLMIIYDSKYGERYRISPFWSRGYYKVRTTKGISKISSEQLDTTLNKFHVCRIVTGHTVVADTISVHYDGKVINTDTKHAKGLSEALLIDGNRYYRVNDKGDKVLLFIDDKIKRG